MTYISIGITHPHPHETFRIDAGTVGIHPHLPDWMFFRYHSLHALSEDLPAKPVVVQAKETNKTLNVVVDECMIEFREDFFQRFGGDTVARKELEVDAG